LGVQGALSTLADEGIQLFNSICGPQRLLLFLQLPKRATVTADKGILIILGRNFVQEIQKNSAKIFFKNRYMYEIIFLAIAGAVGALIKEILADNKIKLPKIVQGELDLGFIGSIVIGAFVGYVVDGSFLTAAMAGFAGFSVIENLVGKKNSQNSSNKIIIAGIIRYIAKEEGVDPDLAVRVATCESGLSPTAQNVNQGGSVDRGLSQINNKYHPKVTDQQAYDIVFSTRFFCRAFKDGHLSWWDASKKCWNGKLKVGNLK